MNLRFPVHPVVCPFLVCMVAVFNVPSFTCPLDHGQRQNIHRIGPETGTESLSAAQQGQHWCLKLIVGLGSVSKTGTGTGSLPETDTGTASEPGTGTGSVLKSHTGTSLVLETDTRTKSVPEAMTGTRSVTESDTWTELLLVTERRQVPKTAGGAGSTHNTGIDTGTRSVLKIDTRTRRQVPETEWDSGMGQGQRLGQDQCPWTDTGKGKRERSKAVRETKQ